MVKIIVLQKFVYSKNDECAISSQDLLEVPILKYKSVIILNLTSEVEEFHSRSFQVPTSLTRSVCSKTQGVP